MISSTFISNQFAALAESWWQHYHGQTLAKKMQAKQGVYVMDQGVVLAIAYLYPTHGSEICYLGFTVRNPEISHIRAGRALKLLLSQAEQTTKALGYSILHTTFEVESLRKLVRRAGYVSCAETQILIKDLNHGSSSS